MIFAVGHPLWDVWKLIRMKKLIRPLCDVWNILIGVQDFCWPKFINPLGQKYYSAQTKEYLPWWCVLFFLWTFWRWNGRILVTCRTRTLNRTFSRYNHFKWTWGLFFYRTHEFLRPLWLFHWTWRLFNWKTFVLIFFRHNFLQCWISFHLFFIVWIECQDI